MTEQWIWLTKGPLLGCKSAGEHTAWFLCTLNIKTRFLPSLVSIPLNQRKRLSVLPSHSISKANDEN